MYIIRYKGNKLAQGVKILMCIMEVPGSDIGRNTGYSDFKLFLDFCVCPCRSRDSGLNQATAACFLCYSVQLIIGYDPFL